MLALAIIVSGLAARATVHRLYELKGGWRHVDFVSYYAWGLEYEREERVWGPVLLGGEIAPGIRRPSYRNYTPAFVESFAPLTKLGESGAYWSWQSLQLLSFAAALFLLTRGCDPPLGFASALLVVAIGLFFRPFRGVLRYAQCAAMLLLLMTASWLSAVRGRRALSGLFLAGATLIKLYPGAMIGYFVVRRRWREIGWWMGFMMLGFIVTGPREWIDFFRYGVTQALGFVSGYEIGVSANVYTALTRMMPERAHLQVLTISLAITAVIDLIVMAIAWWTTIHASERTEAQGMVFAMWAMLCLLLSPLIWPYELVLTIPACFFALAYSAKLAPLVREWRSPSSAGLAASASAIALIELRDFTGMPGIRPRILSLLVLYFLSCAMVIAGKAVEQHAVEGARAPLDEPAPVNQAQPFRSA